MSSLCLGHSTTEKVAEGLPFSDIPGMDEGKDVMFTVGLSHNASFSSHVSVHSIAAPDKSKCFRSTEILKQPLSSTAPKEVHTLELDLGDSGTAKTSCSDSVSSSYVRD